MKAEDYWRQLEADPEYRQAEEELRLPFALADAILNARLKKGWSQTELARRVGTRQANISRIEAGLANPTLRVIQSICKVLDVDINFSEHGSFRPSPVLIVTITEQIKTTIPAFNWSVPTSSLYSNFSVVYDQKEIVQ
ncbi:MAG: helix-turn-helix transcriptional regulator [Anaerolineales bacterium]|nr:helix-turn-helix transcriptional regulator [Anaerolineales bacterium]